MKKSDAVFGTRITEQRPRDEPFLSSRRLTFRLVLWDCTICNKEGQVTSVRWSVVAVNLLLPQSQPCFKPRSY
jgi:hypothetical protein